jgi:hypothetical protein
MAKTVTLNIDTVVINDKWLRVNTKLNNGEKLEDIKEAKVGIRGKT